MRARPQPARRTCRSSSVNLLLLPPQRDLRSNSMSLQGTNRSRSSAAFGPKARITTRRTSTRYSCYGLRRDRLRSRKNEIAGMIPVQGWRDPVHRAKRLSRASARLCHPHLPGAGRNAKTGEPYGRRRDQRLRQTEPGEWKTGPPLNRPRKRLPLISGRPYHERLEGLRRIVTAVGPFQTKSD